MLQVVEIVRKGCVSEEAEAEERKEKHCAKQVEEGDGRVRR
jgi:hypothetical protein